MKALDSINRLKIFPRIFFNQKLNTYSLTNDWEGTIEKGRDESYKCAVVCIPPPILPSQPMSLCIRMGVGSFSSYTRDSILHCGISDSKGKVYNFDEYGHNECTWYESLSFPLVCSSSFSSNNVYHITEKQWDKNLEHYHIAHKTNLPKSMYNASNNNCYDYVTDFLNTIHWNNSSNHTKDTIVNTYLEPTVLNMEKYLFLWKRILN